MLNERYFIFGTTYPNDKKIAIHTKGIRAIYHNHCLTHIELGNGRIIILNSDEKMVLCPSTTYLNLYREFKKSNPYSIQF